MHVHVGGPVVGLFFKDPHLQVADVVLRARREQQQIRAPDREVLDLLFGVLLSRYRIYIRIYKHGYRACAKGTLIAKVR
jgi:hypothetical protein